VRRTPILAFPHPGGRNYVLSLHRFKTRHPFNLEALHGFGFELEGWLKSPWSIML
jgi:hypothetical protein